MEFLNNILEKTYLTKVDIIYLLKTEGKEKELLFAKSAEIKEKQVGNIVYLRGLIEMSNICSKNCLYCGIRIDNKNVKRYNISDDEILECVDFAYKSKYASIVIQSGEIANESFTERIESLLKSIKTRTNNEIGITLSLGEQSKETYERWYNAGAHRYLLRIESSNKELYYKIHPNNAKHNFEERINCLESLKEIGYYVGTGVMIGLPFQTYDDLADDLFFMQKLDIDRCGGGPFIEHTDTPLYQYKDLLKSKTERFDLTLKMIAVLRIMMKDINIAAPTALQAIDKMGREKAIKIGANIMMPNISPGKYRNLYEIYENKPCTNEEATDCSSCMDIRIGLTKNSIGYGKWGDSKHYKKSN